MTLTINQALDQLTSKSNLNLEQQDLKFSLTSFKMKFGGNTQIENTQQVKNIIEFGSKEGKDEEKGEL
jgi:hypothetical protein